MPQIPPHGLSWPSPRATLRTAVRAGSTSNRAPRGAVEVGMADFDLALKFIEYLLGWFTENIRQNIQAAPVSHTDYHLI